MTSARCQCSAYQPLRTQRSSLDPLPSDFACHSASAACHRTLAQQLSPPPNSFSYFCWAYWDVVPTKTRRFSRAHIPLPRKRPGSRLAAAVALAVGDVLPPSRAALPLTPDVAVANRQCSAYQPFVVHTATQSPDDSVRHHMYGGGGAATAEVRERHFFSKESRKRVDP